MSDLPEPTSWWQRAVVYQIYPRSFAAGQQGSGVGDLEGITEHLDHVAWLGADAIWLSPVFRSPMADFGYDVSDFCDVDPLFGTLADLDRLVAEAHDRGIKVLLDWVPNHTSEQHPWFVESRSSRTNPKADWYVWRDEPPNNWVAAFPPGERAWHWDEARGQWYLRTFAHQQPDLNWDVPEVEAAMHDTLRFWLDRGIDGFRMDVVHLIGKDIGRDDPAEAVARGGPHVPYNDIEVTHDRLRRIRAVLDEYPGERTSVGEVYLLDEEAIARYYGAGDELHMSFNFPFLWTRAEASSLRRRIMRTLEHLAPVGAWPTWVLSNHDVPRHRQRHGGDERVARIMCLVLLTLPGTPFLYQGEELGLVDADVPPDRQVDPGGRDGCRAPIPWSAEPLHGWPAEPWLPFPPESDVRNVATMRDDPASILHLYRDAVALRRDQDDLIGGRLEPLDLGGSVLAHRRGDGWLVVANFGDTAVELPEAAEVALSSCRTLDGATVRSVPTLTALVARTA
ncbi:MAG: putative alpha-glucosidase [Actinomycetota bacterium]